MMARSANWAASIPGAERPTHEPRTVRRGSDSLPPRTAGALRRRGARWCGGALRVCAAMPRTRSQRGRPVTDLRSPGPFMRPLGNCGAPVEYSPREGGSVPGDRQRAHDARPSEFGLTRERRIRGQSRSGRRRSDLRDLDRCAASGIGLASEAARPPRRARRFTGGPDHLRYAKMVGRPGIELGTNRLKGECSTTELAARCLWDGRPQRTVRQPLGVRRAAPALRRAGRSPAARRCPIRWRRSSRGGSPVSRHRPSEFKPGRAADGQFAVACGRSRIVARVVGERAARRRPQRQRNSFTDSAKVATV